MRSLHVSGYMYIPYFPSYVNVFIKQGTLLFLVCIVRDTVSSQAFYTRECFITCYAFKGSFFCMFNFVLTQFSCISAFVFTFLSVCLCNLWLLNEPGWVNDFAQTAQVKSILPGKKLWVVRLDLRPNVFSQIVHLCWFSLVWVKLCLVRWSYYLRIYKGHTCAVSFVCG